MSQAYVAGLNGAVPECTHDPQAFRLCTRAQTGDGARATMAYAEKGPGYTGNRMLFIVGLVIVSVAVVIIPRMRVLGGVNAAALGWMSEQWLAEQRTSSSH